MQFVSEVRGLGYLLQPPGYQLSYPSARSQRAAWSEGDTNLGLTSVAAPNAASSRTQGARRSLDPRPPEVPSFCRLAPALIRLTSTANPSPPTSRFRIQRRKAVSNTRRANVRCLRKARRLSQERLAELTDLDQPHISEIEAGLINLALDNVQAVALALGVEPFNLLKPTN